MHDQTQLAGQRPNVVDSAHEGDGKHCQSRDTNSKALDITSRDHCAGDNQKNDGACAAGSWDLVGTAMVRNVKEACAARPPCERSNADDGCYEAGATYRNQRWDSQGNDPSPERISTDILWTGHRQSLDLVP
jgi:hypothetical protein